MSSFKKNNLKTNNIQNPIKKINYYKINHTIPNNVYFNLNISICIHCYDLKIFYELMFYIKNFFKFKWKRIQIIIHYVNQELKTIENIIEEIFVNLLTIDICDYFIFIKGKNIGGDIGGFLQCCEFIKIDDDLLSIIHTKTDDIWRRQMMNIFTKEGIYTSIKLFEKNNIGMIGSSYNTEYFQKKYPIGINKIYIPMIQNICNLIKFEFNVDNLINCHFVAGTIFMFKKELLLNIIHKRQLIYNLCLDLDKLYSMNKKRPKNNTYEHAMEIMFGYIAYQMKQDLVGVH